MTTRTTEDYWDDLYRCGLGAPRYPNSYAVRWLFANFPRQQAAEYRLLDMGTGVGRHAMLMAREGYAVVATDVSPTSIAQAKEWAKGEGREITFRVAPAELQPFTDQSFDGVICYGVLYYLSRRKFDLAVQEIHRLLKPGGVTFVMIKNDRDIRKRKGERVAPHQYKITEQEEGMPWNNEVGMTLTLLSKPEVMDSFAVFSEIMIEEATSTLDNGKYLEAAWLIYAKK